MRRTLPPLLSLLLVVQHPMAWGSGVVEHPVLAPLAKEQSQPKQPPSRPGSKLPQAGSQLTVPLLAATFPDEVRARDELARRLFLHLGDDDPAYAILVESRSGMLSVFSREEGSLRESLRLASTPSRTTLRPEGGESVERFRLFQPLELVERKVTGKNTRRTRGRRRGQGKPQAATAPAPTRTQKEVLSWEASAPERSIPRKNSKRRGRARKAVSARPTTPGVIFSETGGRGSFTLSPEDFAALGVHILPHRTPILVVPDLATAEHSLKQHVTTVGEESGEERFSPLTSAPFLESLETWRSAWEASDTQAYSEFYSERFESLGRGRDTWLEQKRKTASQEGIKGRQITLHHPRVVRLGDRTYVTFLQAYAGGRRKDIGFKVLAFEREGTQWSIISEHWRPGGQRDVIGQRH